jgi:Zn-dependent peptidase ImmA (M78 family)
MILLSLRGKYEDIFWFSFYHEAAHILLHGKKGTFVEESRANKDTREMEADSLAEDFLIDASLWNRFMAQRPLFSAADVRQFAGEAGVSPAVVIGRLQHEKRIERSHLNQLRQKLDFALRAQSTLE